MMLETMEQGYEVYGEAEKNHFMVRLYCVDPSSRLKEYLDQCRLGIFFLLRYCRCNIINNFWGEIRPWTLFPYRLLLIRNENFWPLRRWTSRYKQRGPLLYEKIVPSGENLVGQKWKLYHFLSLLRNDGTGICAG